MPEEVDCQHRMGPVGLHRTGRWGHRKMILLTHTPSKQVSSVFHQVAREGKLGREQKEDDGLRQCWG